MKHQAISWKADEYHFQRKGNDWFWALSIISATGAAAAVILNNILFGVLILIGSFVLALYATVRPRRISFEISERGVSIGKTFYPYQNLKSFWVHDEGKDGDQVLIIESGKTFSPLITIPISSVSPEKIRYFLLEFLPEIEHELPIADKLLERIGF